MLHPHRGAGKIREVRRTHPKPLHSVCQRRNAHFSRTLFSSPNRDMNGDYEMPMLGNAAADSDDIYINLKSKIKFITSTPRAR